MQNDRFWGGRESIQDMAQLSAYLWHRVIRDRLFEQVAEGKGCVVVVDDRQIIE